MSKSKMKIKILTLSEAKSNALGNVDEEVAQENFREALQAAARLKAYADSRVMGFLPSRRTKNQSSAFPKSNSVKR
jgi:hypothetical protein